MPWPRTKPAVAVLMSLAMRPDGLDIVARHPAVDDRHHAVPVEQHVEGDDRRHHEQADHRDQRHAGTPDRGEHRGQQAEAGGQQRVQPVAQAIGVDAEFLFQPFRIEAGDQALQPGQIFRQLAGEIGHLRGQHRNEDDEGQHQHDEEGDEDDHRRHQARQAEPLQPVGDRIEEIGQHHAGDEGQQDAAEDIEEERQEDGADQPEADLAAECAGRSGSAAAARLRPQVPGVEPSP